MRTTISAASCLLAIVSFAATDKTTPPARVRLYRVPNNGIQPQVVTDSAGTVHLVYYSGEPAHGDVHYAQSRDGGVTFSKAIRVNSQPGSAVATGTIRGAQIALGTNGRVHVAWNGSMQAKPEGPLNPESGKPGMPMLYTRMDDTNAAFEPQRNLMHRSHGLDGGGSVTADRKGNVYVAWHALGNDEAGKGEAGRQVWIAHSADDGKTFAAEQKAWQRATGACGCCGMKIFADPNGNVHALYRSATEAVHRDIWLISSTDRGRRFDGQLLHKWDLNACPMSSMDFAADAKTLVGAWETAGQVYWASLRGSREPVPAPGDGKGRKHPRTAVNASGDVLLVWTEATGWQRGGAMAWQVYDREGHPRADKGRLDGVPAWSFGAVAALPDGRFFVLY
jgi:hypothetical protein